MLIRYIFLFAILSGCATTDEERIDWNQIKDDFYTFTDGCEDLGGSLHIPRKRVPNGIPTPWEMQDSICYLDGRSIQMTEW